MLLHNSGLTPEAVEGGMINNIRNGDMLCLDVKNGKLALEESSEELIKRIKNNKVELNNGITYGRFLFNTIRENISNAELGATIFKDYEGKE